MSKARTFLLALLTAVLAAPATPAPSDPDLLIFAAASLTESMQEAGQAFEAKSKTPVRFSFGASSDLARQIEAGAPADVFFSADTTKMDALEKSGLVRKGERREFLSNRLAVVVPAEAASAPSSAEELVKLPRIALADPKVVPAGIYAKKWLESLGLWEQAAPKVVPTLDVRSALAAVETQAAPAAVVYTTDAAISKKVRVAFVVQNGPGITYSLARVAGSKNPQAVPFVDFLASPEGRAIFEKRGFLMRGGG